MHFLKLPRFSAVTLILTACVFSNVAAKEPNILFIAVDDLRPELGCYGTRAITPNLDRLAAEGLKFNRAYCNQAVCGASRTSLMTGLYPEFTGLRSFHVEGWRKKLDGVATLNETLKENGYLTLGLGKIYHSSGGPAVDLDNWNEWFNVSAPPYLNPDNAALHAKNSKLNKTTGQSPKRGPVTESADVEDNEYVDGKRRDLAVKLLGQLGDKSSDSGPLNATTHDSEKPFFLAVGFTKPHLPFIAPQKYWDLYKREDFSLPPNAGVPPGYPAGASNTKPGEIYHYAGIPQDKNPKAWPEDLNAELIHGYHACVSYMDANVGAVLDALDKNGLAENTIVILWGDHGWKLGDHSSWCKHTNFETDTRVPLIIKHPGMKQAKGETNALVELIDLYPTICDLTGVAPPAHLQGKSLMPILKDPATATTRETALSSYPARVSGKGTIGNSIRTATHRYTEWWDGDTVLTAVATDLETDPGETTAVTDEALLEGFSKLVKERVKNARKATGVSLKK